MKKNNYSSESRNGFTLVELLVVITIIAALAALGFVSIAKMRKNADAAKQISIVHEVGPLMTLFSTENNGVLPAGVTTKALGSIHWHHALHALISPELTIGQIQSSNYWNKKNPLIKNPLYKKPIANGGGTLDSKNWWVPGYGMNSKLVDNTKTPVDYSNGEWQGNKGVALSKIGDLARTPLVAPAPDYHYSTIKAKDPRMEQFIINNQIPVLFVDGHVESMAPKDYETRKLHEMPR